METYVENGGAWTWRFGFRVLVPEHRVDGPRIWEKWWVHVFAVVADV